MKWGGCFFVKKWTLPPQSEMKLMLDLFFILHFTYLGVHMHPTHPPAYWPGAEVCFMPYYAFLFHAWKKWSDQDAV